MKPSGIVFLLINTFYNNSIKTKGVKYMIAVMKREIKNYLKRPLFWIGFFIVLAGVFHDLKPYMEIHYIRSEEEINRELPEYSANGEITEGYVPVPENAEKERRKIWEKGIRENLISEFGMSERESDAVLKEMEGMDIEKACRYLKETYQYYNAYYSYEDTKKHLGTKEEINAYLDEQMKERPFSSYFSLKFADFAGLYMGFFSAVMLAFLFWQDTRKNTYELLHTKPVSSWQYVFGKAAGGFLVCCMVLGILNLVFWGILYADTGSSGFEIRLTDFLLATGKYILPNMFMVVSVYTLISILFKNPLPGVPLLILYMIYSNMGSFNEAGEFGYYGRPLAVMVRFPGDFFTVKVPDITGFNQCFLILASFVILLISVWLWKKRRI